MDRTLSRKLIKEMKLGWNLGNTLDCPPGETGWGNPVTTRDMIKKIKELGFNTVRVPVSWHRHMDPGHIIFPEFMDRVAEVVGWVLDEGMFAILNIHHDNHEFQPTDEGVEKGKNYLSTVWKQVSERFESAPERLIFEGMNEPRLIRDPHEWHLDMKDETCRKAAEHINTFNQVFVDIVRASGGNNASRLLMVPSYAAGPAHAFMPEFRLPGDPADRLIVSIHVYDPQGLALLPDPDNTEFNEHGKKVLDFIFGSAYEKFVSKDVPVVIGEMGIVDKQNPDDRCRWCKYFVRNALDKEILSVWWDNGGRDFKLLDRRNLSVYKDAEPVLTGLLEGLKG